jgi:hypothetical protein
MDFSTRCTVGLGADAAIHSCDSRVRPYFAKRARALSCCIALRSTSLAVVGVGGVEVLGVMGLMKSVCVEDGVSCALTRQV